MQILLSSIQKQCQILILTIQSPMLWNHYTYLQIIMSLLHFQDAHDKIKQPQPLRQQQHNQSDGDQPIYEYKPSLKIKIICSYLYFIQGVIISLPGTMPLVYHQLPSYHVLSFFSAAVIPFSFKFIFAPLQQKFAIKDYGKRKTWIIISQIMSSFILFIGSFFTGDDTQIQLALLFMLVLTFVTLQDIALDAMSIKQMKIPYMVGQTQTIMQTFGIIFGSLIFLKGSSEQFALSIGLDGPILSPKVLMQIISFLILIPTLAIHFSYQETILNSQTQIVKKNFCSILEYYKIFLDLSSRYCRTAIMFLLYIQGFHFFTAGYEYQLIQIGFKKNTINTINNFSLIPVSIIIILISSRVSEKAWIKFMVGEMGVRWILYIILLITFPTITDENGDRIPSELSQNSFVVQVEFVAFIVFIIQFLDTLHFLLGSILVNSFPVIGVSGMYITLLNSSYNFGNLKTLHLKLIGFFGWKVCSYFGLVIQLIIIVFMPRIFKFINLAGLFGQGKCLTESLEEQLLALNTSDKTKESPDKEKELNDLEKMQK